MGLFFRSRKRSGGGGILTLAVILGVLYYTGLLPKAWDHIKESGNYCSSALGSVGYGVQSVCGTLNAGLNAIDEGVEGAGSSIREWVGDVSDQASSDWETSDTRMSIEGLGNQLQHALSSFSSSGLTSSQSSLEALMRVGPGGASFGSGQMDQMRGALDSFAIGQQLKSSQPGLSMEWMQKGASMGEFGLPSQLSLGNIYANSGNNYAAAAYFQQAQGSLSALQASNSPASQQMLQGMSVSPQKLQEQITAAIKQMKIGR